MENCASKRQVDRRNTFLSFLLHPGADSVADALRQGPED
jgi:hypothetical protein